MTDTKEPEVGDFRIVEDLEDAAKNWPWRYDIEIYVEGGSFLFWKWGPSWRKYETDLKLDQARNLFALYTSKRERSKVVEHG